MEHSERRSRYDRERSISSTRDRSRTRPKALSFSRSPSTRGRRPQRTRSLDRSRSSSSLSSFSSPSRSRSRRRQAARSYHKSKHQSKEPEEKKGALAALKSAAPLLATIGVASVVAHKFWPKGVLFGDKEDWETKKVVERRARTVIKDEDGGVRRARSVRQRRDGDDWVVDEVVRGKERRERPASAYYGDERRYARPPPAGSSYHERREERPYLEERYQPRHGERYEDPRFDDMRYEERTPRPRGYVDDREYYDRGRGPR